MAFTFKTEKPTGKWKSFQATYHYIKLNKNEVGNIEDRLPHTIRLMVIKNDILEDGNKNCEWKWITLNHKFETKDKAKEWLNENFDRLNTIYKFPIN